MLADCGREKWVGWPVAMAVAMALGLAGAGDGSAAGKTIELVADEWPPFSGAALPNQGLAIDISRSALVRAGYEVEVELLPWARIVHGSQNAEFDAITSIFRDPQFEPGMVYSDPFIETPVRFVQQKGAGHTITDLDSLRPFTIAVGAGFLYEPAFDRADYLDKFEVTTTLQAVRMVAAERVDLTLDSEHVLNHAIHIQDPGLADQVEILDTVLVTPAIHMAVARQRDDHEEIIARFNAALAGMKADGSLQEIFDRHDTARIE